MEETTVWFVSGRGVSRQEFSELEFAEFFALRMSEASGYPLNITKHDWMKNRSDFVRTVQPHEFKLMPCRKPKEPLKPVRPRPLTPLEHATLAVGVQEPFTASELRSAYRKAALKAHPDTGGSKEAFQTLSMHYEFIKKVKGF